MAYDPSKHRRRSIRLKGYDYTGAGAYFITICTDGRTCLFGGVVAGKMRLNDFGKIVQATWNHLPDHYQVELDAFVVMPNHVHGVVVIAGTAAAPEPNAGDPPDPVGAGFKPAPTSPANRNAPMSDANAPMSDANAPAADANAPAADANVPMAAGPDAGEPPPPVGAGFKPAPTLVARGAKHHGLSEIVRGFKTFSARRINEHRRTPGTPVWQRNYYEHIIRDEASLQRIRRYIANNPARWAYDRELSSARRS
jgi:REP element-mobilizing transposase RayT